MPDDRAVAFNLPSIRTGTYEMYGRFHDLHAAAMQDVIDKTALPVPLEAYGVPIGLVTDLYIYEGVSMEPHLRVRGGTTEKHLGIIKALQFAAPVTKTTDGCWTVFARFAMTNDLMEPIDEINDRNSNS